MVFLILAFTLLHNAAVIGNTELTFKKEIPPLETLALRKYIFHYLYKVKDEDLPRFLPEYLLHTIILIRTTQGHIPQDKINKALLNALFLRNLSKNYPQIINQKPLVTYAQKISGDFTLTIENLKNNAYYIPDLTLQTLLQLGAITEPHNSLFISSLPLPLNDARLFKDNQAEELIKKYSAYNYHHYYYQIYGPEDF